MERLTKLGDRLAPLVRVDDFDGERLREDRSRLKRGDLRQLAHALRVDARTEGPASDFENVRVLVLGRGLHKRLPDDAEHRVGEGLGANAVVDRACNGLHAASHARRDQPALCGRWVRNGR